MPVLLVLLIAALAQPDPRPVVVSGEGLGPLFGAAADEVAAFAVRDGRLVEVPVQVDERFVYDVARVYAGLTPGDCPRAWWCRDLEGHVVTLGYADPGTHVGPDPLPGLDADDEVALLAADFGTPLAEGQVPEGVDPASGVEVRVEVGDEERAVTLWRRRSARPAPDAGVTYAAQFERGSYLSTYDRAGRRPPWIGWPLGFPSGTRTGLNPEDSWVRTPHYALAFSDRWILDRLHVGPPEARGPDLLDIDMVMFGPGVCQRTPRTGALSEGGFLVNRSGPVRAIRRAVGFNSGPLVETEWTFYPRLAESRTALRVHPIPGVIAFLDLSDEAEGATYRSARLHSGARVDGRPDWLPEGEVEWEAVERDGGGWTVRHEVTARVPGVRVVPFYADSARPDQPPCMGDRQFLGAHGVWARGPIPNTDPRHGEAGALVLRRTFAFGGDTEADLDALRQPLVPRLRALGRPAAPPAGGGAPERP